MIRVLNHAAADLCYHISTIPMHLKAFCASLTGQRARRSYFVYVEKRESHFYQVFAESRDKAAAAALDKHLSGQPSDARGQRTVTECRLDWSEPPRL
jgi:sarcosine oxidase gamma subunit